jgi:endonuclease YncB( thermonuclease family)
MIDGGRSWRPLAFSGVAKPTETTTREPTTKFNPPPNWPPPPEGFVPPPGWRPDPTWGPPPDGWPLWINDPRPRQKKVAWWASGIFASLLVISSLIDESNDGATTQDQSSTTSTRSAPTVTANAAPPHGTPSPRTEPQGPPTQPPVVGPAVLVTVVDVVDGDTIEIQTGERVRLIGIDSPEQNECGSGEATANLEARVLRKQVELQTVPGRPNSDDARLLRYVVADGVDAGLDQISKGLAVARYDSRDGFGAHPNEASYIAADSASPNVACAAAPPQDPEPGAPNPEAPPVPEPAAPPVSESPARRTSEPETGCHPSYRPCVPDDRDYDCPELDGPYQVIGPDEYRLDRDNDGTGCE